MNSSDTTYVVREWKNQDKNDLEHAQHRFDKIADAISKAESLNKTQFDAFKADGTWHPLVRRDDGRWEQGKTIAEIVLNQEDKQAAKAIERNHEAIVTGRDSGSLTSDAVKQFAQQDAVALASIQSRDERRFASVDIGLNASENKTYRDELQRVSPQVAQEAENAVKDDVRRQLEKEDRKAATPSRDGSGTPDRTIAEPKEQEDRKHLTTRDVVIGAAHAAQLTGIGGPAAHTVAQGIGLADAAKLTKDSLEGKDVRAIDVAAAAASVTLTTGVGGPAAQTAAKGVAALSALDAADRTIATVDDAVNKTRPGAEREVGNQPAKEPEIRQDVEIAALRDIKARQQGVKDELILTEFIEAERAKSMAKADLEAVMKIRTPEHQAEAIEVIRENMKNETYKRTIETTDQEASKAIELLAGKPRERQGTDTEAAQPSMVIDEATKERLAANRNRDTEAVQRALGIPSDRQNPDEFVNNLDKRMAKAHLGDQGWRDRTDIDDVMADLKNLSQRDQQTATKLWDKYRPGDNDKPLFIDGDDLSPSKAGRSDPTKESGRQQISKEGDGEDKEFVTPELLRKKFLQAENKFYFRDEENKLAFEDKGKRLSTDHNDPEVARSMVELAEAKGWNSIKLKGTDEFKREVWLQASLKGMEVQGFQPRDVDLAKLEDARKEAGRTADKALNSIEHVPERFTQVDRSEGRETAPQRTQAVDRSAVVDENYQTLSAKQRATIDGMAAYFKTDKKYSNEDIATMAEVAAERVQNSRVYVGKLLEHGPAPYDNDPKKEPNYYVKMETGSGEKVVWGVDLERAVNTGKAKVGEDIVIAYQGKQQVPVTVKERDAAGKVIGESQIMTNRNTWDVRPLDAVRDEAKERLLEAASKGDRQPLFKVYDRDAARAEERPEPVREPVRENERARS